VDSAFASRRARLAGRSRRGSFARELERDGARWGIDGAAAPHLDGLIDIDLESSAVTNCFPVRRMAIADGATVAAPAVYLRAIDLSVERLDQTYRRKGERRYAYLAPRFGADFDLDYDAGGLVTDYPGLAARVQ
jgi:hypothetical protein